MKELDKYETSVLTMMQMKVCRPSTSPKLEKQTEPGDDDPCEHPELYRSAVCTILYMTKRRPDLQATTRWKCKRFRNPNKKSWRQSVGQEMGSRDLATFMPKAGKPDIIEAFLDGDWACDDLDRKSTSGGYLMVGGCRLHSHNRTTGQHALSNGESEIMSMSEVLKEAKLMQYNLEFCGLGLLPIVLHTDADVARAFCHKRSVGRMKHLDVRHCSLQEELEKGSFKVERVDRKFNASDMLTHSPKAEELRKFLPMVGCHTMTVNRENYNCSQDDAEVDAYSENDCILDELGRCSEVLIADDLARVAVRMDEFALSALSRESAFNSSSHVSVLNCCSALDAIIVT